MKKIIRNLFHVNDSKTRLAKSLFFGAFLSLLIGYFTSETSYYKITSNKEYVISKSHYDSMNDYNQRKWVKRTEYNSLLILIALVCGTGLGYSVLKEKNTFTIKDTHKWN